MTDDPQSAGGQRDRVLPGDLQDGQDVILGRDLDHHIRAVLMTPQLAGHGGERPRVMAVVVEDRRRGEDPVLADREPQGCGGLTEG